MLSVRPQCLEWEDRRVQGHIPVHSCFYTQIDPCPDSSHTPKYLWCAPRTLPLKPTAHCTNSRRAVLCSYLELKKTILSASKAALRMSFLFGKSFMLHKHMLFWSPQVMKGGNSTLVKKCANVSIRLSLSPTFSQSELKVSPWFSLGLLQSLWCPLKGKAQTETEPFVFLLAPILPDAEHSQSQDSS